MDDAPLFADEPLDDICTMWRELAVIARNLACTPDCIDTPKDLRVSMEFAAMAEACAWRSTGDCESIDAHRFLPVMRDSDGNPQGENGEAG